MGLNRGILWPYEGSDLKLFNGMMTYPWGYVELRISIWEVRDIRSSGSQFLVVPCKTVYNCIIGKPFTSTLDTVASLIHLKLKFYNLHSESLIINVGLEGLKGYIKRSSKTKMRKQGNANQCYFINCPTQKHEHLTSQKGLIEREAEHEE